MSLKMFLSLVQRLMIKSSKFSVGISCYDFIRFGAQKLMEVEFLCFLDIKLFMKM